MRKEYIRPLSRNVAVTAADGLLQAASVVSDDETNISWGGDSQSMTPEDYNNLPVDSRNENRWNDLW